MNLTNTGIDLLHRCLLMTGKQGLMHPITLDLIDLRALEVIQDQAYLNSPQTQRWSIITTTTIIIIRRKDLRVYMVILPLPPLLLLGIGS